MYGFEGWLLKVDGVEFPTSLIAYNSYKCTPDQQTDLDDYTDANGVFHRNVLPAKASKIELEVHACYLKDKIQIQQIIGDRETCEVEYWNDEHNCYMSGTFYVPDISFEIHRVIGDNIVYNAIRIAFIEYGGIR